jgi:hypothetical protein
MGEANRRNRLGRQTQVNVDASTLEDRVCKCGGMVFSHALSLKVMTPLISPSGQYETAMAPLGFVCVACGTVVSLRPEIPKEESMIKLVRDHNEKVN